MKIIRDLRSPYHINLFNILRRHGYGYWNIQVESKKCGRATVRDIILPDECVKYLGEKWQWMIEDYPSLASEKKE